MKATKEQKLAIRRNSQFKEDIKEEWVQWATGDNSKTSLNDLSFEQANQILAQQGDKLYKGDNWGLFNNNDSKHKCILSLMYQLNWTIEIKGRNVPDTNRLSEFLKSIKSPVQKPLNKMNVFELSKIIKALEEMTKKTWK
ncbi:hypothetical protein [Flavobacterium sp. HSC-61S13]|uniref:hypothetical protein n=1 Tax=Flavobacterium sp. HSC-61S13 TaxID=2910963 RepID=UPI0020A0BE28|nr:hypothetical protein [Flavobacterium sp. HSC-61S13]MCP1997279.1 hypothetical protein [Flavobacterium sp. HSC-61S13]